MAVPSYLSSFVLQRLVVAPAEFPKRFGGAWLVWEPGSWTAPAQSGGVLSTLVASGPATRPGQGDALCFLLGASPRLVRVGREPDNDVVINDGTVSRQQFSLVCDGAGWWVEPHNDKTRLLPDTKLSSGLRQPLSSGAQLGAGGVRLTFLDAAGFEARLRRS